jgi:cell division transport system ATP-binding protein
LIEFSDVSKRYAGGFEALKDISFSIARGEMLFLTGRSGAGKSSLLKLIMLMERPSAGRIVVNGLDLGTLPSRKVPALRRDIGVVFQNHQLLSDRSVFDNVALPLTILGYQPREIARRVRAALDKVGLLSKEKMNPLTLSGGAAARRPRARGSP